MSYGNRNHILGVFNLSKLSFHCIFVIKHTWVGPTIRAKSHQHIFLWLSSTALFTLHTTRSQLYFHTTTSSSLPLPYPHLLTHTVTNQSLANPHRPNLGNTLLAPLHRSSFPTSFSAFSPLRRYFIHLIFW